MKLRAIAPALVALGALIALYVYVTRDPEPATSTPAKPPVATAPTPAATAPAPTTTPPPSAPDTAAPAITPHVLTSDEFAGHEPHAKKAKMTLDEKLAETRTHIEVMERRAKLLEAEIAELDRTGQADKAAEQRVVLQRLKAHADKLREDVAAGREPE